MPEVAFHVPCPSLAVAVTPGTPVLTAASIACRVALWPAAHEAADAGAVRAAAVTAATTAAPVSPVRTDMSSPLPSMAFVGERDRVGEGRVAAAKGS